MVVNKRINNVEKIQKSGGVLKKEIFIQFKEEIVVSLFRYGYRNLS